MTDPRNARRRQRLEALGVAPGIIPEILACDDTPYSRAVAAQTGTLPLPDEPLAASWTSYAEEATAAGVLETLRRHLVQLRFPIAAGMSETEAYRAATRRGDFSAAEPFNPGLELDQPESLGLTVLQTMAGRLPVLVAGDRGDFVRLVQALTGRNEPIDVPTAMGACLVKGLNNWSRVAEYRLAWTERTGERDASAWAAEFKQLIPRKSLYQDQLVILSRGPYSATPASATGLAPDEWIEQSLAIRREHELAHCFTYRVFGSMRSHVVDEVVADFIGLLRATGSYRAGLALRFLGLEAWPAYRRGGRLEHYRGSPPLSDPAFEAVQALTVQAARNLETLAASAAVPCTDLDRLGRLTLGLVTLTIEEIASADMAMLAAGEAP